MSQSDEDKFDEDKFDELISQLGQSSMRYTAKEDQYVACLRKLFLDGISIESIRDKLIEDFISDRGGKGIHPNNLARLIRRIESGEVS